MELPIESAKKKRTYHDRQAIQELLKDYRQSGLSQVAYARERGLNVGTLRGWLYKNRKVATGGLCEVVLGCERAERDEAMAVVRLANGSEVELPLCAGMAWVERIIRELVRG